MRKHAEKAEVVDVHIVRAKITAPQTPDFVESRVRDTAIAKVHRRGKQILIGLPEVIRSYRCVSM